MHDMRRGASFAVTRCALLAALAAVLYYAEIPVVAFYSLDLSTVPAILAGFAMGPAQGAAVVVLKNLAHMPGTGTACVGELADILMSGAYVVPAGEIYRRHRTRRGALLAMLAGTAAMTAAGVLTNAFVLIPAYRTLMNLPEEAIIAMGRAALPFVDSVPELVLCITAPFNLLKGGVLSAVTFLLYKRVSPLLHSGGA